MNKTLIRRYAAYILAIAVTVLFVSIFSGRLIRDASRRQTVHTLEETARIFKQLLLSNEPNLSGSEIDRLAKTVGTRALRITTINKDGKVLADSDAEISVLENHAGRE